MFSKKTVDEVDVNGKTVLVRVDYNVPLAGGKVSDDYRIRQSLPTINYLIEHQAKVILIAHLGRPDGKPDPKLSLSPVAQVLAKLLGREVIFASDCIGKPLSNKLKQLEVGQVLLCENLRFHPEEEANDQKFAKELAKSAELFVQDGFGVVHRAHASTEAITHFLPSVAGFLLKQEVDAITEVMTNPNRPIMAIMGGAKIADKLELIKRFIALADVVALGGGLANTMLLASGVDIGASLADRDEIPLAHDILKLAYQEAERREFLFILPFDGVVSKKIESQTSLRIVDWRTHVVADLEAYPKRVPLSAATVETDEKILDIGPFSGSFIVGCMQRMNTVVWNGTMGVTEVKSLQSPVGPFAHGTELIIDGLLGQFGHRPYSLLGGGDTSGYIESRGLIDQFNHVSTGGGASLELMAGRTLPGLAALEDK